MSWALLAFPSIRSGVIGGRVTVACDDATGRLTCRECSTHVGPEPSHFTRKSNHQGPVCPERNPAHRALMLRELDRAGKMLLITQRIGLIDWMRRIL